MTTRFLYTSLIVLFVNSLFAQVSVKPKAGLNLNALHRSRDGFYSSYNKQTLKIGFHAGVNAEFGVAEQLFLQAELLYHQKGLKDKSAIPIDGSYAYEGYGYRLHYIELPVLLRYASRSKFIFGAGIFSAYLAGTEFFLGGKKRQLSNSSLSRWDGGIVGDLSYQLKTIELGVRYSHGFGTIKQLFTDVDPEIYTDRVEPLGQNRSFQLSVSYVINR